MVVAAFPGRGRHSGILCKFEGKMYTNLVGNGYLSVRPALWVDYEAANLKANN